MSHLKNKNNGDDHPDAAGKHFEDADALLSSNRYDGAAYLAGYAVECTMKTIALLEKKRLSGHDLNSLSASALTFASLPGAATAKYARAAATSLKYGLPAGWQETLRYRSPGEIARPTAEAWVREAGRLITEVVTKMRLDGLIKP